MQHNDFVISADEKTSLQARRPKQPTLPPAPRRAMRVEPEYFREGAWTYLAAGDVHRAQLFGRCETNSGIAPTDHLIAEVMSQPPYQSANRVFWIMDNCSAHRGQKTVQRLPSQWPNVSWSTPDSCQLAQSSRDLLLHFFRSTTNKPHLRLMEVHAPPSRQSIGQAPAKNCLARALRRPHAGGYFSREPRR